MILHGATAKHAHIVFISVIVAGILSFWPLASRESGIADCGHCCAALHRSVSAPLVAAHQRLAVCPRGSTLEPRSTGADGAPRTWRHAKGKQAAQRLRHIADAPTVTRQLSRCQLLQEAGHNTIATVFSLRFMASEAGQRA